MFVSIGLRVLRNDVLVELIGWPHGIENKAAVRVRQQVDRPSEEVGLRSGISVGDASAADHSCLSELCRVLESPPNDFTPRML
jgi:hypothetical protein